MWFEGVTSGNFKVERLACFGEGLDELGPSLKFETLKEHQIRRNSEYRTVPMSCLKLSVK